jgi:hypothetical protein
VFAHRIGILEAWMGLPRQSISNAPSASRLNFWTTGPHSRPSCARLPPQRQQDRLVVSSRCDTAGTHACTASDSCTCSCSRSGRFPRSPSHQVVEPEVAPRRFLLGLCCALDAKRSVLIWNDVILVFGIDGLQVRRNIDVFWRELRGGRVCKGLEEVGMVRVVHVKVCCH